MLSLSIITPPAKRHALPTTVPITNKTSPSHGYTTLEE